MLNLQDMAEIVGVPVVQLRLWLEAGKITATRTERNKQVMLGEEKVYFFSEGDIEPIRRFATKVGPKKQGAKEQFVDDGEQEFFTVAQIASLWHLSTDTIQRMFQDEPGVLPVGKLRGKRRKIRIPRAVMDRIRKRRENS